MSEPNVGELTRILRAAHAGDESAMERLAPRVYVELKAMATRMLRRERSDHTLQATALVNEAWLKIAQQDSFGFEHRRAFFGAAATAMRRILVDHARARGSQKRGDGQALTPIEYAMDEAIANLEDKSASIVDVTEAIDDLAKLHPLKAKLVELKCFLGLTTKEAADVLDASLRTTERDWTFAKAWLRRRLSSVRE